jgi:hypothetical protein
VSTLNFDKSFCHQRFRITPIDNNVAPLDPGPWRQDSTPLAMLGTAMTNRDTIQCQHCDASLRLCTSCSHTDPHNGKVSSESRGSRRLAQSNVRLEQTGFGPHSSSVFMRMSNTKTASYARHMRLSTSFIV